MTKLLEKAIESVRELEATEQDAIAQMMLDEMESERLWDKALARSPEKLEALADRAWGEHQAGKSMPLDPDRL